MSNELFRKLCLLRCNYKKYGMAGRPKKSLTTCQQNIAPQRCQLHAEHLRQKAQHFVRRKETEQLGNDLRHCDRLVALYLHSRPRSSAYLIP
jgi:hypothetical protein